ncbi:MAG TPA: hypothetical protein VGC65_11970 [Bacteroidia bacterium]
MKKLLIVAVILMSTTVQMFAGPIVTIRFEIGRESMGCNRFGICDPSVDVGGKMSSMQIDENSNMLLININSELTAGKEQYFTGSTVTFEEIEIIPAEIQKALGARTNINIPAGSYKLTKTRLGFQISIPLSQTQTSQVR